MTPRICLGERGGLLARKGIWCAERPEDGDGELEGSGGAGFIWCFLLNLGAMAMFFVFL